MLVYVIRGGEGVLIIYIESMYHYIEKKSTEREWKIQHTRDDYIIKR